MTLRHPRIGARLGQLVGCQKGSVALVAAGTAVPLVAAAADVVGVLHASEGVTWPQVALYLGVAVVPTVLVKAMGTFDRLITLFEGLRSDAREGLLRFPTVPIEHHHVTDTEQAP